MLRVRNTEQAPEGQIELSDLVLKVEWPVPNAERPLYWRTGDFQRSLLEIGLHPVTGRLVSVTAVLLPQLEPWTTETRSLSDVEKRHVNSVPVFHLANWQGTDQFADEPNRIQARLGTDSLLIDWNDQPGTSHCIQSGRVLFGVGEDDALTAIQFVNLSAEEVASIRDMFTS
ncbi:MAG: hypothetical protein CL610_30200 [Anaerolineaceae bacterium]|nr:hypothetical protein [Anaerolineaceae bacterium]